ncbi:glycosyltransferase family 4 protein [Sphingomonas sp. IC4-52]|uniref:glycosyltransferase family 4 protein n=1 Tax=Sphingomonas sp. IC4-52 TaxID=2887202 RepID=UPI001D1125E1|nr:glycosyltransferase family 4 protein [Sphingomonas sp. IC4-52]MCC2980801.1 glycosyltransferase family 4 protein [Sphingomonas sp. IC4-52]
MRILMVSALFPTPSAPKVLGGAEVVARRLADALVARGATITVVRAGPPGTVVKEEEVGAMRVLTVPIRNRYSPFDTEQEHGALAKLLWHARDDWGASADLRDVIGRERPDVLHTHNIGALSTGVWRAAAAEKVPIVHTLHDYYLLCPRTTRFRYETVCARQCRDCRLLTHQRRADTSMVGDVVGVSHAVLQPHLDKKLFAIARSHVVPNIIQAELAARPHMPGTPVTFGFLGRITLEKGVERLVQAFGAMRGDSRLVFGGQIDDAMKARLTALAGGKAIDFLGFVSPAEFFAAIDVLVVPSIWEDPLPTVILEAQTAGVPAIGSRRGGIVEAMGGDDASWIYDPDAPDALRDMLDRVAADPTAISARAAAAHALAIRFKAEAIVAQYSAVYKVAASTAG